MLLPPLADQPQGSLTERVYFSLKEAILSLHLRPRDPLIIGDLAKAYQISRTPVREAIILLEQEGWVETDGRRGARVTVPSVAKVMDVIEMQAVLEGYVVRKATSILTAAHLEQLDALLTEAEQALAQGSLTLSYRLGERFHESLADIAGNQRISRHIGHLREQVDRIRPLIWKVTQAPVAVSAQQHRQIFQAMCDGDPYGAEERMMNHTLWFEAELARALEHV